MKIILLSSMLAILGAGSLAASDSAAINAPLQNTGVDPDASGSVLAQLSARKSELIVSLRHLGAQHNYDLEFAGVVEASLATDKNGRAQARFRTQKSGNALPLDFDPRGQTLRVLDNGASVLEGVISGTGEADASMVDERAELEAQDLAPDDHGAHASVHFSRDRHGRSAFHVTVSNVSGEGVDVWVDGVERQHIELHGKKGSATFVDAATPDGRHDLSFDPRGKVVDVTRDDSLLFSGAAAARANGVNSATPSLSRVSIPSTGASAGGTASARLRIDNRARKHFSVELEGVAAGAYDLLANGAVVGSIQVTTTTAGATGELEFTSGDDDAGEAPLTFEPVGALLAIEQGGAVLFQGTFDPSAGDPTTVGVPQQISEALTSTGLAPSATAHADFQIDTSGKEKFSVELEGAAPGSYTLSVGGIVRGALTVTASVGETSGEIEFESESESTSSHHTRKGGGSDDGGSKGGDATSLPLNFDPRGQLIEISTAAGDLFSHLFGNGSADAGATLPVEVELPLFNSGAVAAATAEAKFHRRDNSESSLEVETEGLPAGAYDLLVGGVVRGSLTVTATSGETRGRVEFDSASGAAATLLNFDVLGQAIAIQQGGTTFFSRVFPAQ